jgi:hypothetical protein
MTDRVLGLAIYGTIQDNIFMLFYIPVAFWSCVLFLDWRLDK